MIRFAQQVSRAIRILRGNRDESARASHLVVSKDQFAYNELLFVSQAEREKFSQSTFFERKIMSTKTAFKRVALVAAAALAIGGITAVSAYATGNLVLTSPATPIAGPANSAVVTATAAEYVTVSGGTFAGGATTATLLAAGTVTVLTPTVGTITLTGYIQTSPGIYSSSSTDTLAIPVVASLPGTVYASSKVYAGPGVVVPATSVTDGTFSVTAASSTANVANFTVVESDANGVALTSGYKAITAIATNGLLSTPAGNPAGTASLTNTTYISTTQTAAGTVQFNLSGIGGLSGASTVAISVNGGVAKSYSVTFTGAAAKIVVTVENAVIGVAGATATVTANTNALKVQEFDANGNALTVLPLSLTSGTSAAIASVVSPVTLNTVATFADGSAASATAVGITLVGAAVGTSSLTVSDGTLTSNAVSIRVSSASPTKVVYTTDEATYPAGGVGKLTVTVSDAAGTVPAGIYTLATGAATSSLAFAVSPAAAVASPVTVDDSGVASASFNAPLSDGTVSVGGTSTSTVMVTPASFTVTSGASDAANAAVDAANEATDAANAATDAANAAADSADAATQAAQDAGDKADAALAAVTALSQQVTNVLAKVAAISALLVRIIKKVHA